MINGFNWQDWSYVTDCAPLLGPGASCTFEVTFRPTGPGNSRTGLLVVNGDFLDAIIATLDGTAAGASMAVAPDPSGRSGGFAYVADPRAGSVSMYRIDGTTGLLAHLATPTIPAGTGPVSVAVAPSGKFACVANAVSNDLSMYAVGATGGLAPIGLVTTGYDIPSALAVDPSGRCVALTNQGTPIMLLWSIDSASGALSPASGTYLPFQTATSVAISVNPSGRTLACVTYVTGYGTLPESAVFTYGIDTGTWAGSPAGAAGAEVSATSAAFDPSGRFAYVTNSGSGDVSMYGIDPEGALSPLAPPTIGF